MPPDWTMTTPRQGSAGPEHYARHHPASAGKSTPVPPSRKTTATTSAYLAAKAILHPDALADLYLSTADIAARVGVDATVIVRSARDYQRGRPSSHVGMRAR